MNYSLLLQKSLEVMTSSAQGENLSKINEIIDFIGNIKPNSPFYPTQINQFEVSNKSSWIWGDSIFRFGCLFAIFLILL